MSTSDSNYSPPWVAVSIAIFLSIFSVSSILANTIGLYSENGEPNVKRLFTQEKGSQ